MQGPCFSAYSFSLVPSLVQGDFESYMCLETILSIISCFFVHFSREESCGFTLWQYILKIDNWEKFVLYVGLSVVCFLHPKEFWQAVIAGVSLDITALCYLIRTFRSRNEKQAYKYKQLEIR